MRVFDVQHKFRHAYEPLLGHIVYNKVPVERNERTGKQVKMLRHPASFTLSLFDGRLPVCGVRKMFPATAAAEVAWFLQGDQDVSFIKKYAPIWDKFVEDDGVTVEAAYGYRWREHFGRDQVLEAIKALAENPSDRRIWVQAWDPAADGLGAPNQKNVPCPVGFTLSIVDGRLNSALTIRSSDVFVGLPYDVMGHAIFMQAVAASLNAIWGKTPREGVELGYLHVTLAHPHVYDVHWEMALEALNGRPCDESFVMPYWSVAEIEQNPHDFVGVYKALQKEMPQPSFHCRPEVVQ